MAYEDSPLIGYWDKSSTAGCSAIYPEHLEFRENGMFYARNEPRGTTIIWDVGQYRIEKPGTIRMTLANDSSELYACSIVGDVLTFVDARTCEFSYRRASEAGG